MVTPEQELRSDMEKLKGHAIRQGYGWRTAAAVGRLLEPIPDEIWEQARKEVGRIAYQWGEDEPNGATGFALLEEASQITNAVERVIRSWLIGGEKS